MTWCLKPNIITAKCNITYMFTSSFHATRLRYFAKGSIIFMLFADSVYSFKRKGIGHNINSFCTNKNTQKK